MQTRTILSAGGILGVGALAMTYMGSHAQDRQYKKTLAYMHDGRDKIASRMEKMTDSAKDVTGVGKK